MALTSTELDPIFRRRIGFAASSDEETACRDLVDEVVADIYHAHEWTWRRKFTQVLTQAPYTEGTVTIDVSTSPTAVSGNGTTWTDITDYASTEDPFFLDVDHRLIRIDSITDATNLVLKTGTDADVTAGAYGIHRMWINLDTTYESIHEVQVVNWGRLPILTPGELDYRFQIYDTASSPEACALVEDTSSKGRRLAIYPHLTGAEVVNIWGKKAPPTPSDESSDCGFPDSFKGMLIHGVLSLWYAEIDDRPDLVGYHEAKYQSMLGSKKDNTDDARQGVRRRSMADEVLPETRVNTGDTYGLR